MKSRLALACAALALLVLLALALSGCGPRQTTQVPVPPPNAPAQPAPTSGEEAGTPAPATTGTTLDGQAFSLADLKGKVVLVDFWATWCAPCRKGIPDLIALQTKYGEQGLQVVGFSVDTEESQVKSFVKQEGINYPILVVDQSVTKDWGGVNSIPATFILDKSGNIREDFVGLQSEATLDETIASLL